MKRLRGQSNRLRVRKEDQGVESPVPTHARPSIPRFLSLILVDAVPLINDAFSITPEWTGVVQAEAVREEQRHSEVKEVAIIVEPKAVVEAIVIVE